MEESKLKKRDVFWWDPPDDFLATEFCIDTSLHGLKYLGQPKRHLIERIFWLAAFAIGFCVAAYFITSVWQKYRDNPVIVSFKSTQTTIESIPFPAITICNVNNVQRSIAEEYIEKVKTVLREGGNDPDAFANLYYLDHVCSTSTFTKNFNFIQERSVDKELVDKILTKINSSKLLDTNKFLAKVAQSCESMIPLCYWGDEIQNCTDIFRPIETDYGYCCSFNIAPSLYLRATDDEEPDPHDIWHGEIINADNVLLPPDLNAEEMAKMKFPKRQHSSGRTSGLSVLLYPDLSSYFCTNTDSYGFQMEAHFSLSVPRVADNGFAVHPSSEVFMNVKPEITTANKDILLFPVNKRQCYAGEEFKLQYYTFYTASNCNSECVANITYEECNCVRYYMPRDGNRSLCGAVKFNCTEKVRIDILRRGIKTICPLCFPLCKEINYDIETTSMPLRNDVNLWMQADGVNAPWAGKNATILHIYLGVDSVYPRVRNQLFGTTDLLSNTGGLLSLCLGFSGLSVLEIIYFITLRAWCRKRGRNMNEYIPNNISPKVWRKVSNYTKTAEEFKKGVDKSYTLANEFSNWTVDSRNKLALEINPAYKTQY